MEVHALVFWEDTKEISVVPEKDLKDGSAKHGRKYYPAKVLMKSASKSWLLSLRVSTNGEILPDFEESQSRELLQMRKTCDQDEKLQQKKKDETKKDRKALLAKSSTIFDEESSDDEQIDETVNNESNQASLDQDGNGQESSEEEEEYSRVCSKAETSSRKENVGVLDGQSVEPDEIDDNSHDTHKAPVDRPCICSKFPDITAEDIEKFEVILSMARMLQAKRPNDEIEHAAKNNVENKAGLSTSKQVPLFEGSTIRVPEWKIRVIADTYKKNAREMVRKLMVLILGKDTLKMSSPTGKGNWKPIPEDTLDDVERFVLEHTKKKYRLTHDEYIKVLTCQCATLRHPKPSGKVSKQETGDRTPAQTKKNSKSSCVNERRELDEREDSDAGDADEIEASKKTSKTSPPHRSKKGIDSQKVNDSSASSKKKQTRESKNQSIKVGHVQEKLRQDSSKGSAEEKKIASIKQIKGLKAKNNGSKDEASSSPPIPAPKNQKFDRDQEKMKAVRVRKEKDMNNSFENDPCDKTAREELGTYEASDSSDGESPQKEVESNAEGSSSDTIQKVVLEIESPLENRKRKDVHGPSSQPKKKMK